MCRTASFTAATLLLAALIAILHAPVVAAADADPASSVIPLDVTSFEQIVVGRGSDRKWLVEFYAPWCGHCQNFAPVYEQVAKELSGRVNVAKVDCPANSALCDRFGVRGYPTIKLIDEATAKVFDFEGTRAQDTVVAFALNGWRTTSPSDFPLTSPSAATTGAALMGSLPSGFAENPTPYLAYWTLVIFFFGSVFYFIYEYVRSEGGETPSKAV